MLRNNVSLLQDGTMTQFGATGKNPPWVRTATAATLGQPTQLTSPLLVQATIGGPGVTSAQTATPVALQQQQQQQQTVPQQAAAYNAAGIAALSLAQVGVDQSRENVFLVQNAAALQQGAVLAQPGVALPTSLTAAPVGTAANFSNYPLDSGFEMSHKLQPGLALPTTLTTTPVATVSYPAPRVLQHATQFQQQAPQPQQQQQHPPKQRVFTGTVSKLHDNFGFVDDDVFFQTTCVKGAMPKVGDRVLVEATFNGAMPFKWNAIRIQVLPNQSQVQVQMQAQMQAPQAPPQAQTCLRSGLIGSSAPSQTMAQIQQNSAAVASQQLTLTLAPQPGPAMAPTVTLQTQLAQPSPAYNQVPPPTNLHTMNQGPSSANRLPALMGTRRHSPPPPREISASAAFRREREIRREERRERERHRDREHERERERAPAPRKRSRSPRPRSRSPPRRRLRVIPRYVVQIPKISLDVKEANILELRKRYSSMYIPSDFFFSSFVWMDAFPLSRPFVLERPCTFHVMNKEVEPVHDIDAVAEPPDVDHAFTAKVMLLAAPPLEDIYHKSCALADDPSEAKENFVHPTRLISFLVGLKNKNETMAIGGPWSPSLDGANPESDPSVLIKTAIRTCKAQTGIDLSPCTKWYRFAEIYYHRGETTHKGRVVPSRVETVVLFLPDVWSCTPTRKEWHNMAANYKKQLQKKLHEETPEANENQATEDMSKDCAKKDPSHHSDLDPKTMKITDLRRELEVRNLSSKGLKSQLIARLTKALKAEHDKEEEEEGRFEEEDVEDDEKVDVDEKDDDKRKKEEEERRKEEKEKAVRERRYTLPESPSIIVHPSRTAKGGKFDCTVMSLSVLLDYRQEDNKEYSFEVSLFAELFNEMLMRDFGFRLYWALVEVPEKKELDDKDREKDKKKEKDKREERKASTEDNTENAKDNTVAKKEEKKKREEEEREGMSIMEEENDEEEEEDEEIDEEEEEERRDKKKDDKKKEKDRKLEKVKLFTADPALLLACVYFDQNHSGYLLDKDLEEILYTLGLSLSRAQVRKLLQNVITKDKLQYRKLTDKPKPKDDNEKVNDKNDKELTKDKNDKVTPNLEELSLGNKSLLTVVKHHLSNTEENSTGKGPPDVSNDGLVMYNGALLDISKLLQQLQRSEKARTETDQKLKSIQEELDDAKDVATSTELSNQKLSSELRDLKKKCRSTEDDLKIQQDRSHKCADAIKMCYDIMKPFVLQQTEGPTCVIKQETESGNGEQAVDSSANRDEQPTNDALKEEVFENGDTV